MLGAIPFIASVVCCVCESRLVVANEHLEKERLLRQSERKGRINLQKTKRSSNIERSEAEGYRFKPIGYVESPFKDKRGTPRQPILVSAARGRIKLNVQAEYFNELREFSHIWVVFVFHGNTNEGGNDSAKITPPRLGRRVGCLSTRLVTALFKIYQLIPTVTAIFT
jgi:hypothetical protein